VHVIVADTRRERGRGGSGREVNDDAHNMVQTFFVNGQLDGDMRQVLVDLWVRKGLDSREVPRVFMKVGNGANSFCKTKRRFVSVSAKAATGGSTYEHAMLYITCNAKN
jgi:hypothetical protein